MNHLNRQSEQTAVEKLSSDEQRQSVLLVDDEAKILRGLERIIGFEFKVYTAISAVEALMFLAKYPIDLVLSDNLMPGMLGTEFLEKVHNDYPHIKLMILSGYMPDATAQRAMSENGVLKVLKKPCDAGRVADAIRELLAS